MEEKNKLIEKKTNAALHATQDKNRIGNELGDLRDQVDIKDRKINVLQRKVIRRKFMQVIPDKLKLLRLVDLCNQNNLLLD